MDNFDLAEALSKYRKAAKLSQKQMAKKLAMSRQAYDRLERGVTHPTYKQVIYIQNILNLDGSVKDEEGPPAPVPSLLSRWYQSKKWRLVKPLIYSYLLWDLSVTYQYSRYINGKHVWADDVPIVPGIIVGIVLCVIYWWYWPPELPFKKRAQNSLINS